MIDEQTIQRVKDSANIVDVISDFYELRKDGVNYQCLCPFHDDRHLGSFKVSPRRNIFKCFGCGEQGGPIDFLMLHEKLSFPDAIRWCGKKYGIDVEGAERIDQKMKRCQPHPAPEPLERLEIPYNMVTQLVSLKNNLYEWMKSLAWTPMERERLDTVFANYAVGTGKDGHVVFWQIDADMKVRTGKMMLYKKDGHRDKDTPHNFDWIHSKLARVGWYDQERLEAEPCYFGEHLLTFFPSATVNIVESEKTALMCATAWGAPKRQIWMATGGLQNINRKKLDRMIREGRHIVLYPDHDGIGEWSERAKAINYDRLTVNSEFIRKNWKKEDGEKADLADILQRLLTPKLPTLDEVIRMHPELSHLEELNKKMNLKIISYEQRGNREQTID